jgi:hypothetical protein
MCPHCEAVFSRKSWWDKHQCYSERSILRWLKQPFLGIDVPYCPLPFFAYSTPRKGLILTYVSPDIGDVWVYKLIEKNNERSEVIVTYEQQYTTTKDVPVER